MWRLDAHSVASGAACGVFFGFLVPIGQIPLAALSVYFVRGNLPVAVVATFVSNPFTYVPIYLIAHRVGSSLLMVLGLGALSPLAGSEMATEASGLLAVGPPLAAGLLMLAVIGALVAYCASRAAWQGARAWRARKVRRRMQRLRLVRRQRTRSN